jgi:hypothetical protein
MREINLKPKIMKLSYFNHKHLAKELGKKHGLKAGPTRLLESVFFWALQKNDVTNTVAVDGRSLKRLEALEEAGLIKITDVRTRFKSYYGAEILGEWELDTKWEDGYLVR